MKKEKCSKKWLYIIIIFLILIIITQCEVEEEGNVALIKVHGVISSTSSNDFFASEGTSSEEIVKFIKEAEEDDMIKVVVFEINSPGGSPVGGEEIVNAIKNMNKTSIALIKDYGASAGYWVASACDKVYASRMSIVGSVGVNAAYFDFSGMMDDYNVSYNSLTGGKYKDIGSPFRETTSEEEERLNEKISLMHEYFLNDVVVNRNLNLEQRNEIKEADFYIGLQAIDLGLIDEFGSNKEVFDYVENLINEELEIKVFEKEIGFLDSFGGMKSQSVLENKGVKVELK